MSFFTKACFQWGRVHTEFDPHFFKYPFIKNLNMNKNMRTKNNFFCWNILALSISSIIQDISGNILNLVCGLTLYLLIDYIGPG